MVAHHEEALVVSPEVLSSHDLELVAAVLGDLGRPRGQPVVALLHRHAAGERIDDRGPADDQRLVDVLERKSEALPLSACRGSLAALASSSSVGHPGSRGRIARLRAGWSAIVRDPEAARHARIRTRMLQGPRGRLISADAPPRILGSRSSVFTRKIAHFYGLRGLDVTHRIAWLSRLRIGHLARARTRLNGGRAGRGDG